MSIKKFEEFTYGGDEMDPKDWPGAGKASYEIDREKKFTKKDLMDAAYAFTDDSVHVEKGFEDWYQKTHGSKKLAGTFAGPTTR
jgi:hypothetical protein